MSSQMTSTFPAKKATKKSRVIALRTPEKPNNHENLGPQSVKYKKRKLKQNISGSSAESGGGGKGDVSVSPGCSI
jgi:hypothetical protein